MSKRVFKVLLGVGIACFSAITLCAYLIVVSLSLKPLHGWILLLIPATLVPYGVELFFFRGRYSIVLWRKIVGYCLFYMPVLGIVALLVGCYRFHWLR